ncbi:hypothetical protein EJ04DRAFT_175673 [Polyplosphaeria fusca]|uniref:Uncharacterized protein n=1 Tax=Polyplosphaeria fusca TaxID=682080 RepID=A0A9P4V310_9PLEO|nr:hypothetical protein EJ04DRAFT_175673 [Polyplosphaeria fusca]
MRLAQSGSPIPTHNENFKARVSLGGHLRQLPYSTSSSTAGCTNCAFSDQRGRHHHHHLAWQRCRRWKCRRCRGSTCRSFARCRRLVQQAVLQTREWR